MSASIVNKSSVMSSEGDSSSSVLNNEFIDTLSLDKDKALVLVKQKAITRIGDLSKYSQVFHNVFILTLLE